MITLQIDIRDAARPMLARIRTGLKNSGRLHAKLAADAEAYIRRTGAEKSKSQHRTANTLGAKPTGHLAKAFAAIEGISTNDQAILRVPRASRLRAAFGDYVLRPGSGKKYLTIPAHPEAYGKRAGEFDDLFFVRVGPRQTPALARTSPNKDTAEVMYFLTKAAKIPHDPTLIRFDLLAKEASDSVEQFIDDIIREGTP